LIQGIRQIADLAKMGVFGALFGTVASIPIVYFFREKGIVPSLVAVAAMTIGTSWWYSRKIRVESPALTASEVGKEATALLKLGFAFMSSGFMTMGVAYAVRIAVLRKVGFEATGLYQAAWTLGGLYVGFILQAMGADFYPRLTAEVNNHAVCNRLVNEQAKVGLLLAGPGVVATLSFAPLVLRLFYSSQFDGAVELLRWICLGATLQVITWPMGFIILAKGKSSLFFFCEAAWTVVAVALAWSCVRMFNLNGAGIAFFGSYVFHGFLLYPVVRRLSGFRWSPENWRTILLFLFCIAIVFCGFYFLHGYWPVVLGSCVFLFLAAHSVRMIVSLVSLASLPSPLRRVLGASRGILKVQGG
jgi:PST family polysaccharide transporter